MKTIPNIKFTITSSDGKNETVATLLQSTLNSSPQGGFDVATLRARARVFDAVEKQKEDSELSLEDQDFSTAVQCVRDVRWLSFHRDLLKFSELFGL